MKNVVIAVIGVLAMALVGAACSSDNSVSGSAATTAAAAPPAADAATVNGVGLAKSDFDADLHDYAANSLFVATGQAGDDAASGTVSSDFLRKTLQSDILFEVVRQEVEKRNLTMRPTDDPSVRAQTIARFDQTGSPDIFNAFPKRFQDRALAQTAGFVTLQDALGGGPVDASKVRAAYDADPRRFGEICVRHVLLLTEDDAKRVAAELQQGADFTQTATKETEDTSSEPYGGKIVNADGSCPRASQLDADFAKAALAATPGQPTAPVQTKLGWHIILVDSVNVLPYEQVQTDAAVVAEQDIAAKAAPAVNQILQAGVAGAIAVAAEYGTWDPSSHQILPPGFRAEPARTSPPATT